MVVLTDLLLPKLWKSSQWCRTLSFCTWKIYSLTIILIIKRVTMAKVKFIFYNAAMKIKWLYVKDLADGGHITTSILEAVEMIAHNMTMIKAWLSLLLWWELEKLCPETNCSEKKTGISWLITEFFWLTLQHTFILLWKFSS